MSGLRQLIHEIHRRSLWQVLAIYLVGSWIGYEVIQSLTEGLGLPGWFPALALLLFIVGLPIVLATAFVQEGVGPAEALDEPTALPGAETSGAAPPADVARQEARGARRLFTWHNAILGGMAAFALWGVVATGWLFFAGRQDEKSVAASVERKMLVVLPFENLGPPEDAYFVDGTTDAITARLAAIRGLGVISRTSAIQYRRTEKNLQEIGEELGVDYVLEGTVQRERPGDPASRVRVIPQLIRVSDDTHIWSDTYDEDMREVFRVQSEIAERVARALDITLLEPERRSLETGPTDNLEAYEYYLRGHDYLSNKSSAGDASALRSAVELFERAIELDSTFALAYAELSDAHRELFSSFADPSDERLAQAKAAVDKALELQSDLPEAHLSLGLYYYSGAAPDARRALEEFEIVAQRRPNSALARSLIAAMQAARGEWDQALENIALAVDLDPRSPELAIPAGLFHLLARRYAVAEQYLNRAISLAPDQPDAYRDKIGLYLLWEGDKEKAREVVGEMMTRVRPAEVARALVLYAGTLIADGDYDRIFERLSPASFSGARPFDYFLIKAAFYRLRNQPSRARAYHDSLLTVLEGLPEARATDPLLNLYVGVAYAGLGRKAEAIRHAEQAASLLSTVSRTDDAAMQRAPIWIYAMLGEYDAAMDQIEYLLSVPSTLSIPYLRVERFPGRLREHPRYQRLLAGDTPHAGEEPVEPGRPEPARASYEAARDAAGEARRSAVQAGAAALRLEPFQRGESLRDAAQDAAEAGRHSEAERHMGLARVAYDDARRSAVATWRTKLDSAWEALSSLRSGADQAAPGYTQAEDSWQRAERAEQAGNYSEALTHLSNAAEAYRSAAPAVAVRPAPPETAAVAPEPSAREVVEATLVELRRAIETEDIDALRRVWLGLSADQIRNFETSFRLMRDLKVSFDVRSLDVSADQITVTVQTTYDFLDERSRRRQSQTFPQTLELAQRNGRWTVVGSRD